MPVTLPGVFYFYGHLFEMPCLFMPLSIFKTRPVFLTLLLAHVAWLNAQHPAWKNYTTNDGLPSNEVYGMVQDKRGMLWLGTDQGICRFNGYQFIRPVDTSMAASSSAFHPFEDVQGRIWFLHLEPKLWVVENDTVRPWKYNAVIDAYRGKFTIIRDKDCAVEKDGTLWIALSEVGFLVVRPDGSHRIIPDLGRPVIVFTEVEQRALLVSESGRDMEKSLNLVRAGLSSETIRWQQGKVISLGNFPLKYTENANSAKIWRLRNGDFILRNYQTFYLIRNNQMVWHGQKELAAEALLEDWDGSILIASLTGPNQGLLRYPSVDHFLRDEFDNLLPGHEVTDVLRDRDGGWWASTRDAGIFYCKNPELDIYDAASGLPVSDVLLLTSDARETVYAGLRSTQICQLHPNSRRINFIPSPPKAESNRFFDLKFDTLTQRLWYSNPLCYWENNRWTFSFFPFAQGLRQVGVKKISTAPNNSQWWGSSAYGFFSTGRISGKSTRIPPPPLDRIRTFAVTPDLNGDIWVTTLEGLQRWRNNRYEPPPFDHPALRFQARDVKLLPPAAGGGMAITLRGGGLLIRDQTGRFTHLTTREGLTSDRLTDLDITAHGVIHACSNAGLNIISPQANGTWRIETLTMKHGLPSNQVNNVVLLGNEIWVATDKGIARFREKPQPVPMPAPVLEKFAINNRDTVFNPNLQLAHHQNNIALRFFALHFRSGGDIPYRYRLLGADTTFVYTHTREVNFANLSPGEYTFEVQAQNEDGQWSDLARWPFEIRPPWWATWWFRSLVAAALSAIAFLFYRNRLHAIRREAAEREKIRDLESAALRAQMNPHFIFNCLQAIQSFIAQNEREAAATYLARFAKLVRLALHGSVDGHHTLTEEMEMLENYLLLEQMRFRGKFEFNIGVEAGLAPQEITLPPLLVQPFVENALIHGLRGRENGGFVEVFFAKKGNALEVSVTDNGQGFLEKEKGADEKHQHKSVGMMLTQKRLDLLAGNAAGEARFSRETISDEKGTVAGARVQIWIPIIS